MSTARTGAAVTAYRTDSLFVFGGIAAGGTVLSTAEMFRASTNTWTPIASLPDPSADAAAVVVDGRILIIGGRDDERAVDDVHIYDPVTNSWTEGESMREDRDGLAAGLVNGQLYALGGADDDDVLLSGVERLEGSSWEDYSPWALSPARASSGFATLNGGLIVAGGFSALGPLASVIRFVPGSSGVPLPALPTGRGDLALAARNGEVYAVGGRDASNAALTSVLLLRTGETSWQEQAALPEARENAAVAILGTKLYVFGGKGPFGSVASSGWVREMGNVSQTERPASGLDLSVSAWPNPTSGMMTIGLASRAETRVSVEVVDVLGRTVALVFDGPLGPTERFISWDSSALTPGIFSLLVRSETGLATHRFVRAR